ncbi:MAG: hypothetical protein FVQ83_09930 [Chloroflexi bacterium]|nr:hypothetical protein [Chloroflexota bacterium]
MAEIRTNQAQALAVLLENKIAKEATEAADVGERSLFRWLAAAEFDEKVSVPTPFKMEYIEV